MWLLLAEATVNVGWIKPALAVMCLALFWTWESLRPYFSPRRGRLRHAGRNAAVAVFNSIVLAVLFGALTVHLAHEAALQRWGLLHQITLPWPLRLLLAVLLLDGWLYLWHRANHRIPLLWRFHRMHHSDDQMDVTTATRFHLGEHLGSASLRLMLIPLLGVEVVHLLVYETLVVAMTMFHHANISIGRWDAVLRWVIVTPYMHKVHHSRWQPETDSNYSTVFSVWDRLARTFRMRDDCRSIELGLDEYHAPRWQTVAGMLATPFVSKPEPKSD